MNELYDLNKIKKDAEHSNIHNYHKYFSTLHALGSRECNIDTSTQLLKGKKWDMFKSYVGGFAERLNFDTFTTEDGGIVYGNEYMKTINLVQNIF